MERYIIAGYQQFSGSAVAEAREFNLYRGKSGRRWLVASDVPNKAEYVYVEGGPGSKGFGGRTLRFKIADGETIELTGPWHSNSRDLFADTGVDVRGMTLAFYVIGIRRGKTKIKCDTAWGPREFDRDTIEDVWYIDEAPMLETERVNHPKKMARELADKLGHSVMLLCSTMGGNSNGPVNPTDPATGKEGRYMAPPEVSND